MEVSKSTSGFEVELRVTTIDNRPKPLVLIAANYREARHYLSSLNRNETKVHIVTPSGGIHMLYGWKREGCDVAYVDGWDRTTGQGAAYKEKVRGFRAYLIENGWIAVLQEGDCQLDTRKKVTK